MKILQLTQSFLPKIGGMEWAVHHLSNELAERGHEVMVLAAENPRRGHGGAEVIRFGPKYLFAEYPFGHRFGEALGLNQKAIIGAMERVKREFDFDLVHAHQVYYPGYCALRGQARLGYPLVITDHGQFFRMIIGHNVPSSRMRRRKIMWTVRNCECWTSPGRDSFDAIMKFRSSSGLSRVIPNGVSVPSREEILHLRETIPQLPYILMVGRYHRVKGFETGLRAFAMFKERYPEIKLVVVGDGLQVLKPYVEELGIKTHTRLVPAETGDLLWRLYAGASVFWMPSLSETQGLTKFEAMCFGLPCVCNNAPGVRNNIIDGENGLIFEENNALDLAKKTIRLYEDHELRLKIGREAASAAERFRWKPVIKEYETLYEELITSKSNTP